MSLREKKAARRDRIPGEVWKYKKKVMEGWIWELRIMTCGLVKRNSCTDSKERGGRGSSGLQEGDINAD